MSKLSSENFDDENLMEIEEDLDAPSSRKISNSIHDFSEIMSVSGGGIPPTRFSGAYNPKRRNLLTESSKNNIISVNTNSNPKTVHNNVKPENHDQKKNEK